MDFNFFIVCRNSPVVSVVQEKILGGQHTSVFFLKDLRRLYQDRLKYLDADEDIIKMLINKAERMLLGEIAGPRERKSGRFVIFKVEQDVGRVIVKCSQNT